MTVNLQTVDGGVLLDIRVYPGSRANELRGTREGRLRVAVTAAPEKGKANKAVCQIVAKLLQLRKSQVSLYAGPASQEKRLLVQGLSKDHLRARIEKAVGQEREG